MWFNVTFGLFAAAVALWIWWRKRHFEFFKDLGVPGPPPSFFFGNLYEFQQGPLECHRKWIEKYGSVVGYYFGLRPMVIVSDPKLLKQMEIKESSVYINRTNLFDFGVGTRKPEFQHQLINLKGQRWKEVRKIMSPAFTSGKIRMMTPAVSSSVDRLIQEIDKKDGKEFDMVPIWQMLTMDVIGKTAFGIENEIIGNEEHPLMKTIRMVFRGRLKSWLMLCLLSFSELSIFTFLFIKLAFLLRHSGISPMTQLLEACAGVIRERRSDPSNKRPDLLQGLVDAVGDVDSISDSQLTATAEDNDKAEKETVVTSKGIKLTNDEVLANALLILLAGYETTSTMLSFTTHFLVNHQNVQDKLRDELNEALKTETEIGYSCIHKLAYMDQVTQEVMRLCPPIFNFITRESVEETTLGGYTFPSKTAFIVPVHYLHNNSNSFPNPEKFDPDRFSTERKSEFDPILWQPFGAGPRNCIGMRFAMMEAKLALAKVIHRYKLASPKEEIEMGAPKLSFSMAVMSVDGGVPIKAIKI